MNQVLLDNWKSEGTFFSLHFTGRQVCPPGHSYDGTRNSFLLHYVESGRGFAGTSKRNAEPIEKGNCFLFYPYTKIHYRADREDPWTYRWIGFSVGQRRRLMLLPGLSGPIITDTEPADGILPLLTEIWGAFEIPNSTRPERDEELLLRVLAVMLTKVRGIARPTESMEAVNYVQETKDYVRANFHNPITCSTIADRIGLDRSYLSREFRKQSGATLKDFLRDIRMKEATRLLLETDLSIGAVAKSVGFREYKAFARNFNLDFGCSARDFRERHLGAAGHSTGLPGDPGAQ